MSLSFLFTILLLFCKQEKNLLLQRTLLCPRIHFIDQDSPKGTENTSLAPPGMSQRWAMTSFWSRLSGCSWVCCVGCCNPCEQYTAPNAREVVQWPQWGPDEAANVCVPMHTSQTLPLNSPTTPHAPQGVRCSGRLAILNPIPGASQRRPAPARDTQCTGQEQGDRH